MYTTIQQEAIRSEHTLKKQKRVDWKIYAKTLHNREVSRREVEKTDGREMQRVNEEV